MIIRRVPVPATVELVNVRSKREAMTRCMPTSCGWRSMPCWRKGPVPALVLDEHNACYQIFERLAIGEVIPVQR